MPQWGERLPHYRVVANLPYYITAAVLRHLLEADMRPARMVVTVQSEVAARMVAEPGDMSLLAISVQFYGEPRVCMRLKRGAFYPVPDVESAVVRIDMYDAPPVPVTDVEHFLPRGEGRVCPTAQATAEHAVRDAGASGDRCGRCAERGRCRPHTAGGDAVAGGMGTHRQ